MKHYDLDTLHYMIAKAEKNIARFSKCETQKDIQLFYSALSAKESAEIEIKRREKICELVMKKGSAR